MEKRKKRGPQPKPRVHIDRKRFLEALEYGNWTIKSLGDSYEVGMTENAIHKQLEHPDGMHEELLNKIAKLVNVDPEFIKGTYNVRPGNFDEEMTKIIESFITPDRFPYVRKESSEVLFEDYYKPMLLMHEIPFDDFLSLAPSVRTLFQYEIEEAIVSILYKYFKEWYEEQFQKTFHKINALEVIYDKFGLDYWTDPKYARSVNNIFNEIELSNEINEDYEEPDEDEMVEVVTYKENGETVRQTMRYGDAIKDYPEECDSMPNDDDN